MQPAGNAKVGRAEALALAKAATRVVVARGRRVIEYDMARASPTDAELLAIILGPTGNLRAPTIRVGGTLVVGFNEEAYRAAMRLG